MADQAFRKDLKHLTWAEVYARQVKRAHLVPAWLEALRLGPGDRVLEIGAGPGYVSMILAERVGPAGAVYAVDRSAEALALLAEHRTERALMQIQPILADAAAPDGLGLAASSALVTMVLHHAEAPVAMLRNVARALRPGGAAVLGEFHPEGPGEYGPPPEHRIAPEQARAWCTEVGLEAIEQQRQTPEHYMLVVRRT